MRNLQLISPFKDATQSADIIPAFRSAIATLPLFNECCLDSTDHPYYKDGDQLTDENNLTYRFNKYGHDICYMPLYSQIYNSTAVVGYKDIYNTYNINFPVQTRSGYNTYTIQYWENIVPVQLYLLKSDTTNGFWLYYDTYKPTKLFITKAIDENNGNEFYSVAYVIFDDSNSNNRICRVYMEGALKTDIQSYNIGRPGYSSKYLIRQLRLSHYLFPDVYIISGGPEIVTQDIITIDNNSYTHLINDVFIRIR